MAKWKEPTCLETKTDYTDLCARLKTSCYLAFDDGTNDYATAEEAAAAIRELVAQKRELALDVLAASGQAQDAYEAQLEAEAKLAECEARLGKAVEALTDIVKDCEAEYPPSHGAIKYFCRTTLAEIEGEKG